MLKSCLACLLLAGPVLAAQPEPAAPPPAIKAPPGDEAPTADALIDRYIEALGGEEAMRKHSSRTDKGNMTIGDITGSMTVYSAAPNKRVGIFVAEGVGTITQGYNGEKGWEIGPQGKRFLEGEALAERARTSDFHQALNLRANYDIRVVGAETFDGKPAYRLGLKHKQAPVAGEQFMIFDAATGLLIGRVTGRQSAAGPVTLETVITDYKPFDGVLTPTKITTLVMGQQQVMTIDSVEFDTVPADAFDVPKELTEDGEK